MTCGGRSRPLPARHDRGGRTALSCARPLLVRCSFPRALPDTPVTCMRATAQGYKHQQVRTMSHRVYRRFPRTRVFKKFPRATVVLQSASQIKTKATVAHASCRSPSRRSRAIPPIAPRRPQLRSAASAAPPPAHSPPASRRRHHADASGAQHDYPQGDPQHTTCAATHAHDPRPSPGAPSRPALPPEAPADSPLSAPTACLTSCPKFRPSTPLRLRARQNPARPSHQWTPTRRARGARP